MPTIMTDDITYISNYRSGRLYLNPAKNGVYASMARDSEIVLGEIDVTARFKIAVSAFYDEKRQDFGTYKITKLKYQKRPGWFEDGVVQLNGMELAQIREFNAIIETLDLNGAERARIDFGDINLSSLVSVLGTKNGGEVLRELSESLSLDRDIFALARKRQVISTFEEMLSTNTDEPEWQSFFELNPWIFGHGLNYVFLEKIGAKLETVTTGADFALRGKRTDALMRTRAEASQFVLIEIKRNRTDLLKKTNYRSGCWSVTGEVASAVTQTQKTVHEFSKKRFRERLKDDEGNDLSEITFAIDPKSYLIIGSLSELRGNDDKITCFELFRRNIRAPEILTFDELFYRAKHMVSNMSQTTPI